MPPRVSHKTIDDTECKGPLCDTDETPGGTWQPLCNFGAESQTWDKLKALCKEWFPLYKFATDGKKTYITGEQKRRTECNDCRNEKRNERRKTDPNYKLLCYTRTRLYQALKGNSKSAHTRELLGCTVDELWKHLESQFVEGMTQENYGPIWHIDHIIPCEAFDLTSEQEQRRCFNWRNLQPMFASENMSKGDKYDFDIVKEIELYAAVTTN